ncbi:hypothetical protein BJY04DRAFT_35153 [Aspergillus karnatakaensis]|uniref:uncharacterized protein n=1 Tax=Aspergillus karnatakaensis TaxID=1810916 RepID=UPI003CCDFB58
MLHSISLLDLQRCCTPGLFGLLSTVCIALQLFSSRSWSRVRSMQHPFHPCHLSISQYSWSMLILPGEYNQTKPCILFTAAEHFTIGTVFGS